mgnify:CR=1 FL=1
MIPTNSKEQIIDAYIKSAKECEKLDNKIILEQTATFAFRSKNCGDVNEPAKDTITGTMLFVWGIKGQVFSGTVLGGTGIFKHKATGLRNWIYKDHFTEEDKYENINFYY